MIDAERIEEMKRLTAEATEGAWKVGEVETLIRTHDGVKIVGEAWRITDGAGAKDAQFIAESRQFVPDIIAAYEFQLERLGAHDTVIKGLSEMVERRDAEIAELRKALEFYADREHYGIYTDASNNCPTTDVLMDDGHIAREALAWRNTTRK